MLTAAERSILRRKLEQYEGRVSHMYLDSEGNVTVGVGHLLATLAKAQRLPFATDKGVPATSEQIAEDYRAVAVLLADERPAYYRRHVKLELADAEVERLTEQHIDSFHRELRVIYRNFDTFPSSVRLALFDMIFNMGASVLRSGWPKLNRAIKAANWCEAARQSFRPQVQAERNDGTRRLFQQAATAGCAR